MTRKRFSKLRKATLIYVVNQLNDLDAKKRLSKVIYSADYGTGYNDSDWLRTNNLYSYQNAYDLLVKNVHKKMIKEVQNNG